MVSVYQLTFFLALGLLGISITVFVLAVSLMGRAIGMAIEAQAKVNEERRQADKEKMEEIEEELKKAKKAGRLPDIERLGKTISSLKRKRWIKAWELRWIQAKPKLLGSVWGAFFPGAFFLASAIVSIIAIIDGGGTPALSPYMWIAIATMGIGVCFVCLSLKVIEGVARTSEEVAFKRDVDIFETSLKQFEEEKRPELTLEFLDEKTPLIFQVGEAKNIKVAITLKKGIIARHTLIHYFAPLGFEFPENVTFVQSKDVDVVGGYLSTYQDLGNCGGDIRTLSTIKIKAPAEADKYIMYYRITCEDRIGSPIEKFDVVVK